MDSTFYLEQGKTLLEKKEAKSMKKALEYLKKANELTPSGDIIKPKVLYFLALANYLSGNFIFSYKIAHKARRSIDISISNSLFKMDNMRNLLGEEDIDNLVSHIKDQFSEFLTFIDIISDDFNENELDFSSINSIYPSIEVENNYSPTFKVDEIKNELLFATFAGMTRNQDTLIYFDKVEGDVLSYVQGYFSSLIGDQSKLNRELAEKIINGEPQDFINESRYIVIDRINLKEFLKEFQIQSENTEPFYSFVHFFEKVILKEFDSYDDITVNDLTFSDVIQKKFHENFSIKYQMQKNELKESYNTIFKNTCNELSLNWILNTIFK